MNTTDDNNNVFDDNNNVTEHSSVEESFSVRDIRNRFENQISKLSNNACFDINNNHSSINRSATYNASFNSNDSYGVSRFKKKENFDVTSPVVSHRDDSLQANMHTPKQDSKTNLTGNGSVLHSTPLVTSVESSYPRPLPSAIKATQDRDDGQSQITPQKTEKLRRFSVKDFQRLRHGSRVLKTSSATHVGSRSSIRTSHRDLYEHGAQNGYTDEKEHYIANSSYNLNATGGCLSHLGEESSVCGCEECKVLRESDNNNDCGASLVSNSLASLQISNSRYNTHTRTDTLPSCFDSLPEDRILATGSSSSGVDPVNVDLRNASGRRDRPAKTATSLFLERMWTAAKHGVRRPISLLPPKFRKSLVGSSYESAAPTTFRPIPSGGDVDTMPNSHESYTESQDDNFSSECGTEIEASSPNEAEHSAFSLNSIMVLLLPPENRNINSSDLEAGETSMVLQQLNLSPALMLIVDEIKEIITKQREVIRQTSNMIDRCKQSAIERNAIRDLIEAEKLLHIAHMRFEAATRELARLKDGAIFQPNFGVLRLSSLTVNFRRNFLDSTFRGAPGLPNPCGGTCYFIFVIRCGYTVHTSELIEYPKGSHDGTFTIKPSHSKSFVENGSDVCGNNTTTQNEPSFNFDLTSSDWSVSIEVYSVIATTRKPRVSICSMNRLRTLQRRSISAQSSAPSYYSPSACPSPCESSRCSSIHSSQTKIADVRTSSFALMTRAYFDLATLLEKRQFFWHELDEFTQSPLEGPIHIQGELQHHGEPYENIIYIKDDDRVFGRQPMQTFVGRLHQRKFGLFPFHSSTLPQTGNNDAPIIELDLSQNMSSHFVTYSQTEDSIFHDFFLRIPSETDGSSCLSSEIPELRGRLLHCCTLSSSATQEWVKRLTDAVTNTDIIKFSNH